MVNFELYGSGWDHADGSAGFFRLDNYSSWLRCSRKMVKSVKVLAPFDANGIWVSQDPCFPEAYVVDLPLDSIPDQDWRDAFQVKWKSSMDFWDRKLSLVDDRVRLVATADGFVDKLTWLEKIIAETNEAINERDRAIKNEKEMLQDAMTKELLMKETLSTETIAKIVGRQFCR